MSRYNYLAMKDKNQLKAVTYYICAETTNTSKLTPKQKGKQKE